MIRSAPRRRAAMTPQRPTAPSPTTATIFPGPTFAASAAWWPVPITSESVSSGGMSASSAADRERDERAVRAAGRAPPRPGRRRAAPAPEAAVEAGGLQALSAELAGAVGPGERSDDEVALLHRPHVGADVLDDADELVAHAAAGRAGLHLLVRPQIAAADAGAGDANEGVGRLDECADRARSRPGRRRRRTSRLLAWISSPRSKSKSARSAPVEGRNGMCL